MVTGSGEVGTVAIRRAGVTVVILLARVHARAQAEFPLPRARRSRRPAPPEEMLPSVAAFSVTDLNAATFVAYKADGSVDYEGVGRRG